MGFFEQLLGNAIIPAILLVLALLANGTGRRQLNKVILTVVGAQINIAGYNFKLMNMLTFCNIVVIMACLAKLHRIQALHANEDEHHHEHADHVAEYFKVVYVTYRNMLMNFCCVLLIICLNVATAQYELYKPIKD